ncbi:ABC transporter substrate-binding protein [Paracoccus litorisediminis]|jgi:iron(III) transport system substrate-binding protein|uniref:ABC transporter substrate-binding protein n=1 Tax=Paracoccus litorisediminis TaxID=2006130 RepID=A0A844HUB5_9RHOB|nr:ABC transporter substrate-binding protein [Paracoccus litorisediminis]MTH61927.1 ABC transporter substrate-binding protein [Paracoccus litorisediminis]
MKTVSVMAALLFGTALPLAAEDFNEAALLAAAKSEPPLVIYDSTGKITEQADAFAAKYGLKATGTKSKVTQTIKIVTAEQQAGNVQASVIAVSDAPAAQAQLIAPGFVENYLPSDLAGKVPAAMQEPLVMNVSADVWTYNTALNDRCPIGNVWQLTLPEWKGRVAMQDPMGKPSYTDWFNQLEEHHDAAMAAAYQAQFGKPLDPARGTATAQWVAALALNQPLLTDSDSDAAQAVGAPDMQDNFVGLVSTGKYRDNDNGMKLGLCADVQPFSGFMGAKTVFITRNAPSPNAAKLFIHYVMTEEGAAPQTIDGKQSGNMSIPMPADEPSGVAAHFDQMTPYDAGTAESDWNRRQDWQDVWAINRAS